MSHLLLFFLILSACGSAPSRRLASAPESSVPRIPPAMQKSYQGPLLVNPDGFKRAPAKVYLPLQFASRESWPLVVLLHGFSGTAESEDSYLTLRYRVSSKGFILLTPDGTITPKGTFGPDGKDLGGNPFWNATDFCCDFGRTKVDDVGYLTKLIETVRAKYNVDPNRIYLFGHSNGGFMANRLACEIGDQIAGIASLAGGAYARAEMCRDPKPIPFLQIHATDDRTISFDSGLPQYAGGKLTVDQWIAKNGCAPRPQRTLSKDFVMLIPDNDTDMDVWRECSTDKPVALWTIKAFTDKYHDGHVPIFNLNFSDAVLDFLLDFQR